MHTPSVVKIHWYLLKLSSGNENTDILRVDNSVKNRQNLPINNLKPDLHNINAHTKFDDIYSSYCPETKIRTDGHSNIARLWATPMLNYHRD